MTTSPSRRRWARILLALATIGVAGAAAAVLSVRFAPDDTSGFGNLARVAGALLVATLSGAAAGAASLLHGRWRGWQAVAAVAVGIAGAGAAGVILSVAVSSMNVVLGVVVAGAGGLSLVAVVATTPLWRRR